MSNRHLLTGTKVFTYSDWKEKFRYQNLSHTTSKLLFGIRLGFVSVLALGACANAITGVALPQESIETCYWDALHEVSAPLNTYFAENAYARHSLLISSSMIVDFLLLSFAVRYVMFGKSCRELVFLVSFYGFRAVIQGLFLMKFPEGLAWDRPPFPSLTVSYALTSDFFYSGHLGVVTFCALENHKAKNYLLAWVSVFSIVFEFFVMVVLRGHYTIDLISGIVFAHYIWIVSGKFSRFLDKKIGYLE